MRNLFVIVSALIAAAACATPPADHPAATAWPLRDAKHIAGLATQVVGTPRAADSAIVFDGKADGVFVPANPIEGWSAFTIEVRFRPDGTGGGEEQRFLHIEDGRKQRVLLETRVTPDKQWALDTFLFQDADHKLTLLDRKLLHPADRWYWVALVYDGKKMSHYIDGVLELEGDVAFAPMTAGKTSLGVRQNLVSWFKGAVAEARFTPSALPAAQLRRESGVQVRQ
jgi:hypothetical protein